MFVSCNCFCFRQWNYQLNVPTQYHSYQCLPSTLAVSVHRPQNNALELRYVYMLFGSLERGCSELFDHFIVHEHSCNCIPTLKKFFLIIFKNMNETTLHHLISLTCMKCEISNHFRLLLNNNNVCIKNIEWVWAASCYWRVILSNEINANYIELSSLGCWQLKKHACTKQCILSNMGRQLDLPIT